MRIVAWLFAFCYFSFLFVKGLTQIFIFLLKEKVKKLLKNAVKNAMCVK